MCAYTYIIDTYIYRERETHVYMYKDRYQFFGIVIDTVGHASQRRSCFRLCVAPHVVRSGALSLFFLLFATLGFLSPNVFGKCISCTVMCSPVFVAWCVCSPFLFPPEENLSTQLFSIIDLSLPRMLPRPPAPINTPPSSLSFNISPRTRDVYIYIYVYICIYYVYIYTYVCIYIYIHILYKI